MVLLFLISINTKAQNKNSEDYLPIAIENANWLIYATEHDNYPPFDDYYFGYFIKGDTIINDISYKKVFYRFYNERPSNEGPETLPLTISNDILLGAIRDDIPNKKVYGIQFCDFEYQNQLTTCPCDTEFLMYDFSMQIGDIYTGHCITQDSDILQDIQQAYIFGQVRTIQYLEVGVPEGAIYQGVGGYSGLFNYVTPYLECYSEPACLELVHYCVGTNEECLSNYVTLAIEENNLEKLFNIYPNPAKNTFIVENKLNLNIKSYRLFDFLGKEIITTTDNNINTSSLDKGIYILQIIPIKFPYELKI